MVYAKAIEDEFHALPPRSPIDGNRFQSGYFWPTERMEALAAVRGDTDTLIAVISQDLTSGHSFERIVAVYEAGGRHREATQWAERGLKAHPDLRGMRPLLARQYERAGLTDEALELYWQYFQRQPTVDTWQALKNAAGQQWSRYRTRALDEVVGASARYTALRARRRKDSEPVRVQHAAAYNRHRHIHQSRVRSTAALVIQSG